MERIENYDLRLKELPAQLGEFLNELKQLHREGFYIDQLTDQGLNMYSWDKIVTMVETLVLKNYLTILPIKQDRGRYKNFYNFTK